ncbi:MAG: hypothetical protein KDA37_03905, partial [Planctomycetales bacterium]|nr:hypothetical protein [Planctomycetales bacterium]
MRARLFLIFLTLALFAGDCLADQRARPPKWTADDRDVFFEHVKSALVGARPDFGELAGAIAKNTAQGESSRVSADGEKWSELISPDTIETEIKRQAQTVTKAAENATAFKGGGYRDARTALSMLALMFRLAAEHDAGARWRDIAPGLSGVFARAAANCKVGTDGSYREAAARAQDLAELIRGGRPDAPNPEPDQKWSDLADRSPIMKRMDVIQQKSLGPLLGSKATFSRSTEEATHEAQVLAALAEILTREEFSDAGDEDYDAFCRALRDAASEISRAADNDDYEA